MASPSPKLAFAHINLGRCFPAPSGDGTIMFDAVTFVRADLARLMTLMDCPRAAGDTKRPIYLQTPLRHVSWKCTKLNSHKARKTRDKPSTIQLRIEFMNQWVSV
jgi:hypothetical protein